MDSPPAAPTVGSSRTEKNATNASAEENQRLQEDGYAQSRHGKFRFKSSRSQSKRDSSPSHRHPGSGHRSHHRRRHYHHGHHRPPKRQKTDPSPPESPPSSHHRSLSPNTAFRESLFDALGDDEGAAFWESVYGQPIHNYAVPSVPKGPDGELERMTEEEYAAYVRARMWERSREGMMEEGERLRQEKAKEKKRAGSQRRQDEERLQFERAMEGSLRRGQERRRAKAWKATWEEYQQSWEELNAVAAKGADAGSATGDEKTFHLRNRIFWPVESGKRRDISREGIVEFMRHGPAGEEDMLTTLKSERVRWHPDKMLHRYGSLGLSDETAMIRSVTEVFQIIDQLWNEEREKAGRKT